MEFQPIRADEAYSLPLAAKLLDVSVSTFKDSYLRTNKVRFHRVAKKYVIPGWCLLEAINQELVTWDEIEYQSKSSTDLTETGSISGGQGVTVAGIKGAPKQSIDT